MAVRGGRRGKQQRRRECALAGATVAGFEGLESRSLFSGGGTLEFAGAIPATTSPTDFRTYGTTVATKGSLALISELGRVTLYNTATNQVVNTYSDPSDPDGQLFHNFGFGVTFFGSGEAFAISAPDDDFGGSVYVYQDPMSSPIVLTAEDYGYDPASQLGERVEFGHALAGYHDHLLIDVPRDMNNNEDGVVLEVNPLTPGVVFRDFHAPEIAVHADSFGSHMAVSGDYILFSTTPSNDEGFDPQTVYLFDGGDFLDEQGNVRKFTNPAGPSHAGRLFGNSMAIDGDVVLIGAPQAEFVIDDLGNATVVGGGVYQFSASTGALVHTYAQPDDIQAGFDGSTYAGWGMGLALKDGKAMIGAGMAPNNEGGTSGRAYLFDTTTFAQLADPIVAPDPDGLFGATIAALPNNQWIVADPASNVGAFNAGQVNIYEYVPASSEDLTPPPTAIAGDDLVAIVNADVALSGADSTAAAVATITSYEWDFDYDGTTFDVDATGVDATAQYAAAGTYTVGLRVTDDHGHTSIDELTVTVNLPPAPTANAGADVGAVAGSSVELHGSSDTGVSYAWDLDDDGQFDDAFDADASVVFAADGPHTISLQVTDAYGQSAVDTLVVTVTATPPSADAGSDTSALAGTSVVLSGVATAGLGSNVANVAWDFDYDGITFDADATTANASTLYNAFGSYTVAFRVVQADGQSAIDTAVITITAAAPTANAGADLSAQTGQSVSLSGTATAGAGAAVASVAWDFNYDGVTFDADATAANASTSYAAAGTYTVAFRVVGTDGQVSIDTAVVTVTAPPPPVTQAGSTVQVAGTAGADSVNFTTNALGQLMVSFNGTTYGPFAGAGRIVLSLGDGNDIVTGNKNIHTDMVIFGGAGNDTITGGGGDDVIIGGTGDDEITAGAGRDLIIGSAGADLLVGKAGQDILISGSTIYDADQTALDAIHAEWTSGRTFDNRIANLYDGTGTATRLNGGYFLRPGTTVFDDVSVDTLGGGGGKDWLIFNATGSGIRDVLSNLTGGDEITDL